MIRCLCLLATVFLLRNPQPAYKGRVVENFNDGWKFFLGDDSNAWKQNYPDAGWRTLNLPHDWSIEGRFNKNNPTTIQEGALPAGIGWYRKTFYIPASFKDKEIYIDFGGIYRDSKVWINGHFLGERPDGYISFRYKLTPYLHYGKQRNVIAVRVNNALQPDSRWYTGSGIYRDVWLVMTNKIAVNHWGTYVTTPRIRKDSASIEIQTTINNSSGRPQTIKLVTEIYDAEGNKIAEMPKPNVLLRNSLTTLSQDLTVNNPILWSVTNPYRYKIITRIISNKQVLDQYPAVLGIRSFHFDEKKGFFLNGHHLEIHGVCLHNDLGALGVAVNKDAIIRRLRLLKVMGCNAIRTAHGPPATEFLNLCDSMGFLVMDEAFDVWKKKKVKYDYHLYWDKWHKRDLEDQVRRDRNHPAVFMWSIGNEIREQFDSTGIPITHELVSIIKKLDDTRPVTSALTEMNPKKNFIYQSGALDVLGINYNCQLYKQLPELFPGQKFIATETTSALETRGYYETPSDSVLHWPKSAKSKFKGNVDHAVSAYDNVAAYWGSTHEEELEAIRKYPFMAGLFVWSGFDYLGEPTPYSWPARSSYFGIIDLAGFPKDAYYLYQSIWTKKPVLHIFPYWNWQPGKIVDVWAYYNDADEVELYLNGKSLGIRRKKEGQMHVMWQVKYQPGILKAVSRKDGKVVLIKEIKTAGHPAKIELMPDRKILKADGKDLCFITVRILDKEGNFVPYADNLVKFYVAGEGAVIATNNGYEADLEPFNSKEHHVFNGLCLVIIKSGTKPGKIQVKAISKGLLSASVTIKSK